MFKNLSVKNFFSTNSESRKGSKRNLEEWSHQKSSTIKRGVCKQLIHCIKEGCESKNSYDKFKVQVPLLLTILRRTNINIIIYLYDILLIGHSLDEILLSRDTVILFLQYLGLIMNWKKSVLIPMQEIEFLGLTINSVALEISLNRTKIQKVVSECQNLLNHPQTSILELIRLIGLVERNYSSSFTARLNCRFLQMQQISSLTENLSYLDKMVLNENAKMKLNWLV